MRPTVGEVELSPGVKLTYTLQVALFWAVFPRESDNGSAD